MGHQYRPLLEVFREALKTLQNEPGPMIPAKAELMEYLRNRIAQHEGLDRATAYEYATAKPPCGAAGPQGGYSWRGPSPQ